MIFCIAFQFYNSKARFVNKFTLSLTLFHK